MTEPYILAIDPGDMTGWCTMTLKGEIIEWENLTQEDFQEKLTALQDAPSVIIYEDFKLFGHKAKQQTGSRFVASQIIGVLKYYGSVRRIPLVVQIPANKDTGAKWSGLRPTGQHNVSHKYDAYNHGFFYLRLHYRIPISLETRNQ